MVPIPGERSWDRDDPNKFHPRSWSFNLGDTTHRRWPGREHGGGGGHNSGAWRHPGLRALPLPGPSAVGRGLEPSCPAWSARWDVLIRPRAIFACAGPGIRGWAASAGGSASSGKGSSAASGGHWPGPRTRARSAARNRPGAGRFERLRPQRAEDRPPRAADAAPEPARPERPAPSRRAHSPPPPAPGVLGVLSASGRGCRRRRPGGLPRRVPARAPARPSGRPARRECQGARGVRAGGGPAGGGGLTDSGLRNAHGPPGPAESPPPGRRLSPALPVSGCGCTCGRGS